MHKTPERRETALIINNTLISLINILSGLPGPHVTSCLLWSLQKSESLWAFCLQRNVLPGNGRLHDCTPPFIKVHLCSCLPRPDTLLSVPSSRWLPNRGGFFIADSPYSKFPGSSSWFAILKKKKKLLFCAPGRPPEDSFPHRHGLLSG